MRYIFSVFCFSLNQAKVLKERLSKIQIQTIMMINIVENKTGINSEFRYCVNILCELTTTKFMSKAIMERIFRVNKMEIFDVDYEKQCTFKFFEENAKEFKTLNNVF